MNQSFQSKLNAAHVELAESGASKKQYDNIIERSFRKLGLNLKPPFYRSFLSNFVVFGVLYFFSLAIVVYAAFWITGIAESFNIVVGIVPASAGALLSAFRYKNDKQRYNLKDWEELS